MLGFDLLNCLNVLCVFLYLVKSVQLSGLLLGNSCSLGLRYVLFVLEPDYQLTFLTLVFGVGISF